jgi:hypothetical protein
MIWTRRKTVSFTVAVIVGAAIWVAFFYVMRIIVLI